MDNAKLAKFITALGRFDNYGSTLAQTQKAIETNCTSYLNQNNDDVVIFEDCLKAISTVKDMDFGLESIIAINSQFNGKADTQPKNPGRLRDTMQNGPDDKTMIKLWHDDNGDLVIHYSPLQVNELDIQKIVEKWKVSEKSKIDAWKMFATQACLQPFQDGNKRTSLISINHAMGKLNDQEYLLPPSGLEFNMFMSNLLRYYHLSGEKLVDEATVALQEFAEYAVKHEPKTTK